MTRVRDKIRSENRTLLGRTLVQVQAGRLEAGQDDAGFHICPVLAICKTFSFKSKG